MDEHSTLKMSRSLLTFLLFLGKRYELNVTQLWNDYQESVHSYEIRRRNIGFIQEQGKGKKKEERDECREKAKVQWKQMSERDRFPYYQLISKRIKTERPLNAYHLFCKTQIPLLRKQFPQKRSNELFSLVSQTWKEEKKKQTQTQMEKTEFREPPPPPPIKPSMESVFYKEDLHEHFRIYLDQKCSIYNDLEVEKPLPVQEQKRRCQLISDYFLENQFNVSSRKTTIQVSEIKTIDPFITQQEKKELEQMIQKQSEKTIEGLRKTYRLLYEQSADHLNKDEILRRMYILERNDLVRSSSDIRGSMIPIEWIDLTEEETDSLTLRRQHYETFDFSTLYRLYRKYLDRSPQCIERDQEDGRLRMIDEIIQYGKEQWIQIHIQKKMGIFLEPKDEYGEWGKVDL